MSAVIYITTETHVCFKFFYTGCCDVRVNSRKNNIVHHSFESFESSSPLFTRIRNNFSYSTFNENFSYTSTDGKICETSTEIRGNTNKNKRVANRNFSNREKRLKTKGTLSPDIWEPPYLPPPNNRISLEFDFFRVSPISSPLARNWSTGFLLLLLLPIRSITSPFTSRGNRHGSVEDGTPLFPSADLLPANGGQSIVLAFPPDSPLR